MALKRPQNILSTFSMASMTDVVFLLLIFFMVTSTFIFPTALEVNLPQSTEQTPLKPVTRVFIQADGNLWLQHGDGEAVKCPSKDNLVSMLKDVITSDIDSNPSIAVYGDAEVPYGTVIDILNIGAENNIKMVLATTPRQTPTTAIADTEGPVADNATTSTQDQVK